MADIDAKSYGSKFYVNKILSFPRQILHILVDRYNT